MAQSIGAARAFSKDTDSQREATTRNQTQRGEWVQRDMGGVADVKAPVFIDLALIKACRDELDAINLCIDLSRLPDEVICERLGIDKGHFSRIRKGRAHFPTARRIQLQWLCGNWAPLQFEMWKTQILDRMEEAQQQRRFA